MWPRKLFLAGLLLILMACEPYAPQVTQEVIVITSAPSATVPNPLGNPIPTQAPPTPTNTPTLTPTATVIPTATLPLCTQTSGTLYETVLASRIFPEGLPYQVYLPPCFFESGRRYPYVLLLHDENKTGKQWLELDLITTLESGLNAQPPLLAPLVLILPSGGDLAASAEFPLGQSYEDVLRTELIPELESTLCLWTNQRMIGGLGRGGFWAYSIALRHPNEFAAVGGHSPDFNPTNAPNSHNPLALAESAQGIERLRMYLDNAQNDRAGANLILFSNLLRERAIEHRYVIQPQSERGAAYWRQYLPAYLAFYSQGLPLSPAELPSCQS